MPKKSRHVPRSRTGQGNVTLSREEFVKRLSERFYDPVFAGISAQVDDVIDAAWETYTEYRKSPRTRKAGKGFEYPDYELSVEWLETRKQIRLAERKQRNKKT